MPIGSTTLPLHRRDLDDLLAEAVAFHGHLCPGQILGVRMAQAGCRAIGVDDPRAAGKSLVIFVEIDRCATDAIQALTGVSLGKRTLKHVDYGKTAATFVNVATGRGVRVAARDDAREAAAHLVPAERDRRRAMLAACAPRAARCAARARRRPTTPMTRVITRRRAGRRSSTRRT